MGNLCTANCTAGSYQADRAGRFCRFVTATNSGAAAESGELTAISWMGRDALYTHLQVWGLVGNLLDNYSDGLVAQLDLRVGAVQSSSMQAQAAAPSLSLGAEPNAAAVANDYDVQALKFHLQTALQLQQA